MLRHNLLGLGSLLTLGALALTAAAAPPPARPPARPKATPATARPADAVAVTMPDGSAVNITGHAGVVLSNVKVQTVFLGDWSGSQSLKATLNSAVDAIVTGPYLDALTSNYGVSHGTHDSSVDIRGNIVNNSITQDDLQKLIVAALVLGRLKPREANRLYLIYPAPGINVQGLAASADNGAHAWWFPDSQPIVYAAINTTGKVAGVTAITSHELAEGATNPSGQGWFDDRFVNLSDPNSKPYHPEIGDLTDGVFLDGVQYPDFNANLNGVNVQLLIDPTGNVIQVPGAAPALRRGATPLRNGAGVAKPKIR